MRLRLEHALLDSGVASDVVVEVEDGWIKSVEDLRQSLTFSGEVSPEDPMDPRLR